MKNPPTTNSRRRFLQVVSVTPVVLHCSGPSDVGPVSVGKISAGNVAALPVGTLSGIGSQPVCIGRDDAGIYAMTLTCPHEGCDMAREGSVTNSAVYCACHGSLFDAHGKVTRGPAHSNLQHFEVTVDAQGELTVDTDSYVDASTRLAV